MPRETSAHAPLAPSEFLLIGLTDGVVIIVLGGLDTLPLFELRLVDLADDAVVIFVDDRVRALLGRAMGGPGGTELLTVASEAVLGRATLSRGGRRAGGGLFITPGSAELLAVTFESVLSCARLSWSGWRFVGGVSRLLGRSLVGRRLRSRLLGETRRVGCQWCPGPGSVSVAPRAHPTIFAALFDHVDGGGLSGWALIECGDECVQVDVPYSIGGGGWPWSLSGCSLRLTRFSLCWSELNEASGEVCGSRAKQLNMSRSGKTIPWVLMLTILAWYAVVIGLGGHR
jgi:hypothetical protein